MKSCLALAAAPAIIRLDSLMPMVPVYSADWHNYVREVAMYHIETDGYIGRWDVLSPLEQYHVDIRMPYLNGHNFEKELFKARAIALPVLQQRLIEKHVRVADMKLLELPQGINWAHNGIWPVPRI